MEDEPLQIEYHVLGDAFVDIIASGVASLPATWGTDTLASGITQLGGGSAANAARNLASLIETEDEPSGSSAFFHGAVGRDSLGAFMMAELEESGVVEVLPPPPPLLLLLLMVGALVVVQTALLLPLPGRCRPR